MDENTAPKSAPPSDHETFQQTIQQLNESFVSQRWMSIAEVTIAFGAIAIMLSKTPESNGRAVDITVMGLFGAFILSRLFRLLRSGEIRSILAKQMEIARRQRRQADRLYGLSILDPLTSLHNRRFGEERLNEEVSRAERSGDGLAILLFDLDCFKEINDTFGHAAGDLALREFARKMKRAIRNCDVPVRIGGDEFLLVLPECSRDKVDLVLERIGTPEVKLNSERIPVRYSVGRAHYQYGDTTSSMLERADQLLYEQKASRRAAVPSSPMDMLGMSEGLI
jgi:diguanylate cyclase (GGDEF)-like protein